MKRFGYFLLAICLLLGNLALFSACKDPADEQPPVNMIDIIKDGQTQYSVVRSEAAYAKQPDAVDAAVNMRKALTTATGADIPIKDDYEQDESGTAYEILIGRTNREATAQLPEALARDEYVILFVGNKILIDAGSASAFAAAQEYFLTTYMGYDKATDTYAKSDLAIPEGLNYTGKFEYPDTVYLIGNIQYITDGKRDNPAHLDVVRLIASLQGRLNKTASETGKWVYYTTDSTDGFWLDYISSEGKFLNGLHQEEVKDWNDFWAIFSEDIKALGIVAWDPDVPSTANVAATICSVEGYLPVRYSEDSKSLYQYLLNQGVQEKISLVDKFTGEGTIPDTDIPSTGSIKCDPYIWAMEKYIDKCNPNMLAYTLDGASCVPGNHIYDTAIAEGKSTSPEWNQLYSHDYLIYNECFFIDLTCTDFEKPCDDPDQPMGTDAETLKKILKYYYDKNNGKMTKLMGFPPWYMKYTTTSGHGSLVGTTLEWNFVEVLSKYNFLKEADAAHPAWMTNGSVYCQYTSTVDYENNEPEVTEEFDENVRYFTIYLGDYDSSAWLKSKIPGYFRDATRGEIPLMWAFNPNLGDRVPMVFDYVYENATENDYFVTGDSGAGYVIPSLIADLNTWVEFNEPYMDKYDMDIVGFIINGNNKMTEEIFAAYAEIAPVGSFHNDSSQKLTVYNDETVFMHLMNGIDPTDLTETPAKMYDYASGTGNNFSAFRTVCYSPSEILACVEAYIEYANAKNDGYTYKYVDPYTLFDLVLQSGQGNYID